jgi:hypothetical protein
LPGLPDFFTALLQIFSAEILQLFHEPEKILHHSSGRGYVTEKIILDPQQNPPATEKSQIPPCTHFPGEEKEIPIKKYSTYRRNQSCKLYKLYSN